MEFKKRCHPESSPGSQHRGRHVDEISRHVRRQEKLNRTIRQYKFLIRILSVFIRARSLKRAFALLLENLEAFLEAELRQFNDVGVLSSDEEVLEDFA